MIESIEQGRKEDGNRSIADKIIKRLHDLDKTVENNQGRWAWELLQNAKDSIAEYDDRKISVQIILDSNNVEFKHNGIHFTEQDVRGIINQISSKEIEEGEHNRRTGRFGTGFLTTHLLSRVIHVKGILETVNKEYFSFEFPLDRDGKLTSQLIPKIENAWSQFHNSAKQISGDYDKSLYNTSFSYRLDTEEQKSIAKMGVEEFIKLIPFVLAFIQKIEKVEIVNNINNCTTIFLNTHENNDEFVIPIRKFENDVKSEILILTKSNEEIAIATIVERNDDGFSIQSINDYPKLFCDFPLIGTETFYFPVIVNSFYFNPQTERDGVWLKGKKDSEDKEVIENQNILGQAVELFNEVLQQISSHSFFNLYNIAESRMPQTNEKYFDEDWYRLSILKPIRQQLLNTKLVEIESDPKEKKLISDVWFPLKSYSENVQENLWQFTYDLFPNAVCKKEHLSSWCAVSWDGWNKITYAEIVKDLAGQTNIEKLSQTLRKNENETYDWLNLLCKFILEEDSNLVHFENSAIIPNQNGIFKKRSELNIDKIKDADLIDILELLGDDWKNILLNDNVGFGRYTVKEKKDIAVKITERLQKPAYKNDDFIKAISLLSEWFENNKELAKELFSELYRKRAELFMNTIADKESLYKVMRSKAGLAQLSQVAQAIEDNPKLLDIVKKGEELASLLSEYNLKDVNGIKELLVQAQNNNSTPIFKREITQDVLVSLGVTSIDELEEALKDKELSSHFYHTSTPNVDMFLYVQGLIDRAKQNVITHLRSLPDYDCSELEELATTVLGGIRKEGLSIHVVVRPSDNGEVIVYYSSEKDTLDYANAELWIDNGREAPKHLTLGKILKTTGINKIPV